MQDKIKTHITTGSVTECLEGLIFIHKLLKTVLKNPYNWKWIILALDNTLQNFMVYTLRDTAGINILRKHIRKPFAQSLRDDSVKRPKEMLDEFLNLYEATKGQEIVQFGDNSKKYEPKGTEETSIKKLHFYRNEFIHFIPKGWLIHVNGMPQILIDCMNYIHFLANHFNFLYVHEEDEKRINPLINKIKKLAEEINIKYKQK